MNEFNEEVRKDELGLRSDSLGDTSNESEQMPANSSTQKKVLGDISAETLNEKILQITQLIKDKFPELSKFLDEIPQDMTNNKLQEPTFHVLSEYYLTLEEILNKYDNQHTDEDKIG